jgi:hypothetical protein
VYKKNKERILQTTYFAVAVDEAIGSHVIQKSGIVTKSGIMEDFVTTQLCTWGFDNLVKIKGKLQNYYLL